MEIGKDMIMEPRILGVSLVIVGCSTFGFKLAIDLYQEIKLLRELIDILDYMECELNYRLTPLPQLCRISAKQSKSLKEIFMCFADEMDSQISTDTASCMKAATYKSSNVNDSVKLLLIELGNSFGNFDLDGQLSGIDSIRQKCVKKLQELEKDKDIRIRNYRTLGMCVGAALAILLF